jgi:hypothetical protein
LGNVHDGSCPLDSIAPGPAGQRPAGSSVLSCTLGYSRDGKKNKLQVNYSLMTTRQGCPILVSVYEGNTSDTKTLMPQVSKLKESFGLERVVLVGDRGMISHKAIGELKDIDGLASITALESGQIRSLIEAGALQLWLFDESGGLGITAAILLHRVSSGRDGERLADVGACTLPLCRSPALAGGLRCCWRRRSPNICTTRHMTSVTSQIRSISLSSANRSSSSPRVEMCPSRY